MADFDVDSLFAEQDERMTLPEEDLDAYLSRVAAYNNGARTWYHASSSILLDEVTEARSVPDSNNMSSGEARLREEVPSEDLRNVNSSGVKRKPSKLEIPGLKRRKKNEDETEIQLAESRADSGSTVSNPASLKLSKRSAKESQSIPAKRKDVNGTSHIDSEAPLSPPDIFIAPGPSIAETVSTTPCKRKTYDEKADSYPRKTFCGPIRSSQKSSAPPRDHDSPISSFPRTLDASAKVTSRKAPVSIAKEGGIEFLPLDDPKAKQSRSKAAAPQARLAAAPVEHKSDEVDPPTSPIEDTSVSVAPAAALKLNPSRVGKSVLPSESKLYLEVKDRVAKHASLKKQRARVLKLPTKAIEISAVVPGGQSSIKATPLHDESDIICTSSPSSSNSPFSPSKVLKKAGMDNNLGRKLDKNKSKSQTKKKAADETVKGLTPAQYVEYLQQKKSEAELKPKKKSSAKPLKDMYLFYASGDMSVATQTTRGRMDFIMKFGGNLQPMFDPNVVTHIIVDQADKKSTLRALGLKRLKDIPMNIPTLKWEWVVAASGKSSLDKKVFEKRMNDLQLIYAAFHERIDAGFNTYASTSKGKARRVEVEDISRISAFTQDKPTNHRVSNIIPDSEDEDNESLEDYSGAPLSPPPSVERPVRLGQASSSKLQLDASLHPPETAEDPLAPFYGEAKAECDTWWARPGEAEESDDNESDDDLGATLPGPPPKRGWTCDKKPEQLKNCPNQDIIDKLEELKKLHMSRPGEDDRWRAFSYSKCIPALRNYPRRIKSFTEARAIRGVGEKTAHKIMEILETGALRRIEYENTGDVQATRLFQGIYGVGQRTAFQWYSAGCRTLEDIKAGKSGVKLTPAQKIGVRFYDDINDRMPRSEAKAIFDIIKPIALSIDPKLFIEIMGSYRREKADCGDIDILITRSPEDGTTHAGVLSRLLQELHAAGVVTEDLALAEKPDNLEAIYRGLCKLPREGARRRRIDFLTVPWKSRGAALLYYTGDDIFNRAIRLKASALGYSLNQRGLYSGVVRDTRDRRTKFNNGSLIASETEEEIFKILGVPWQEPHERVRG